LKILAIDIGAGTEDILLYDDQKKSIENCIKMVLPTPSRVFATSVRTFTALRKDLFLKGDVIGGGALASALKSHLESGLRVVMTENAAYTVRNNLDEVKKLGVEIIAGEEELTNFSGETLQLKEINIEKTRAFLASFNEDLSDVNFVAIAVQDHGVFPEGSSNRKFRINKIKELLTKNPKPETLAFKENEIPSCFLRMKSASFSSRKQLPSAKVLVMDTSPDAILGCLLDSAVEKLDPVLVINVGNGHTMAAILSKGSIVGVLEHHTRLLNLQKLEQLLINFLNGVLFDEDVFQDNGHGVFYLDKTPGLSGIKGIVATGPKRKILTNSRLPIYFAAPGGDVMMTGPVGLVEVTKRKFKLIDR
jgi:uncharacterized protein (DUF1786 family)